jgi:hypothetical protein
MDEHFGSKAKGPLDQVQTWTPSLILAIIPQIPNQMWITIEENLRLIILCDLRNLGLLRAKSFANWHFFHWWHETSHMPNFENTYHKSTYWQLLKLAHTTYIIGQLELWLKMGPFGHPHWEDDMVHNLCKWSFHVWPSQPSNNDTPEAKTFHTCRITRLVVTFKIVSAIYYI